jgi:hypothetical protein
MTVSLYGTSHADGIGSICSAIPGPSTGSSVVTADSETDNLDGFYFGLLSKGGAPTARNAIQPPNGLGWFDDTYSLEGVTIPAGTWNCICNLATSTGSVTGNLYAVFYELDWLGDGYGSPPQTNNNVPICTASLTGVTLTASSQQLTISASGVSQYTFNSGSGSSLGPGLYVELWWEQISGGVSGMTINVAVTNGDTAGTGVPGASGGLEFSLPSPPSNISVSDHSNAAVDAVSVFASITVSDASNVAVDTVGVNGVPKNVSDASNPAVDAVSIYRTYPLPSIPPPVMPLISQGLPVYVSTDFYPATYVNDAAYASLWDSAAAPSVGAPAWVVLDLSSVPATQRRLVVINLLNEGGNLWYSSPANLFENYTIDASAATGGGSPPAVNDSSWVTGLVTVTGNTYSTTQHIVDLTGYNWVRFYCTAAQGSSGDLQVQIDIHDAHLGLSDRWLFSGDSITYEQTLHANFLLQTPAEWGSVINGPISKVVNTVTYGKYYPAVIDGGWAGQTAAGAATNVTDVLNGFNGGFVVIAYGTNDCENAGFNWTAGDNNVKGVYNSLKTLISAALALNNIVICPKIPWSGPDTPYGGYNGNLVNEYMAANLPTDYASEWLSTLFIGPDFYTFYSNNQSLIRTDVGPPPVQLHPTFQEVNGAADGYEEMHSLYAAWMNQNIYQVVPQSTVHTISDSLVVVHTLSDSIVE